MLPAAPPHGAPDLSRPECRRIYNRIRELKATRKQWADRLATTHDPDERENILRTIEGLDNSIQMYEEQLFEEGCYAPTPPPPNFMLKIIGIEITQSVQYFAIEGSGAGVDNRVPLVLNKPLMARAYLQLVFSDSMRVTGRALVMAFNRQTLKYDIFRVQLDPLGPVSMAGSSSSRRRSLNETLNFVLPAAECYGQLQLNVEAWVEGHQGEPIYSANNWERLEFNTRRVPIIHCFRMRVAQTVPGATNPTQLAAPSTANCRGTIDLARRMHPVSGLDFRDRGERAFAGPLETAANYDAVRADILTVRNGTTPTPQDHEVFVGMLPTHGNASGIVFGNALTGSIESIVFMDSMFAHELGHLILPGDDHVSDTACALNGLLTQIDPNYPDYSSAIQRSGIGEWGVDVDQSPPRLFSPETPDVMSYCGDPKWLSPYNFLRGFNGDFLNPFTIVAAAPGADQKLLISFRVKRDGGVDLHWAMHLPGEPRRYPHKGAADLVFELYGADDLQLGAFACHHSSDLPRSAPYEDFQELLPWFDGIAYVLLVRSGQELARWPIEEASGAAVAELKVETKAGSYGPGTIVVTWKRPKDAAKRRHYMLRYTPDDGKTWIPVASGSDMTEAEVDPELLRGIDACRFQLATSTGFRTSLTESHQAVSGAPIRRELRILEPINDRSLFQGEAVMLMGEATAPLSGQGEPLTAWWTSNRDGFLADGLRARVSNLSVGRHVIRLTLAEESGEEEFKSVVVWVHARVGQ